MSGSTDQSHDVPPALAASVALVVAGLAAVGVSGGMLARAVRNEPGLFAATVSLAILVTAVALAVSSWRSGRWGTSLVILGLASIASFGVLIGAASLDVRESPTVALSAVPGESGLTITVAARAAGLRSDDDMLVQLTALEESPETGQYIGPDGLGRLCSLSRLTTNPSVSPPWPGPLLAWQQAGPDSNGDSTITFESSIAPGAYKGLCAGAVYLNPRSSWSGVIFNRLQEWLGLPTGDEVRSSNAILTLE